MDIFNYKLDNFLFPYLDQINEPVNTMWPFNSNKQFLINSLATL